MDANALVFDSSIKIIDENERINEQEVQKIRNERKLREDAFLSEFLKKEREKSKLETQVQIGVKDGSPKRFSGSPSYINHKKSTYLPAKQDIVTKITQGRMKQI